MSLRVAVCGLGSAALRAHLPALTTAAEAGTVRITGVCDPDPDRRARVSERSASARAYPDVVSLLEGARPQLLVVASPPSAHLEAVRSAADRGIDVLCEKPLGLTSSDVQALQRLRAQRPEWLLASVHQYRYAPAWRILARAATAALHGGDAVRLNVEVERPGTDPLSAGGWRAQGDREGGILGDHAVHYLALCHQLDAAAALARCTRSGDPGRESALVRLDLPGGDATIRVTYAGGSRRNRVHADLGDGRLVVDWHGADLTVTGSRRSPSVRATGMLSDRQFVNDLYRPLYDDLLAHRDDPGWRARRTDETVGVAGLLSAALAACA